MKTGCRVGTAVRENEISGVFQKSQELEAHTLSRRYGIKTIHIDMGLFFRILFYIQNRFNVTYSFMTSIVLDYN